VLKNQRGAPGIYRLHMRASPWVSGELGNYCDTSPCYTSIHYCIMGVVTKLYSFNN